MTRHRRRRTLRVSPWVATLMVLAVGLLGTQVLRVGKPPPAEGRSETPVAATAPRPAQPTAPQVVVGDRPDIVLVIADDMRDDDLRFMPRTRRLLTRTGTRFVNSFSPYPLCCPARASLLTGLYTHNHHVEGIHEPYGFDAFDDGSTLATWLDDVGYRTVLLGKYLNGYGDTPVRAPHETMHSSLHYVPPGWDRWLASIDGGLPDSHPQAGGTYAYFNTTLSVDGTRFRNFQGRYQTRVYGDISRRLVRAHSRSTSRPLFMTISYTAPHDGSPQEPDDPPRHVADSDGELTSFDTPARPVDVRGRFDRIRSTPGLRWDDPDFSDKPGYLLAEPPLDESERAAVLELAQQRAEALSVLDQEVARTIRTIDATLGGDTIIIFTSDNGFFLGEQRMRSGKTYPHEPSLRVPFLIRGRGIPEGTRTDPISSIDMAPTIADLAGVTPPGPTDGVSLVRVIEHGDRGWTRGIVTETETTDLPGSPRRLLGLRTARYLYVEAAYGDRELYDLRRDPQQYDNLAVDLRYDRLQGRLARVLEGLKDCRGPECARPLPPSLVDEPPRRG